jgi:hypothetical protein
MDFGLETPSFFLKKLKINDDRPIEQKYFAQPDGRQISWRKCDHRGRMVEK